jgi:hypothetical protein
MGRREEALQMDRDIYCGCVKLFGEEHAKTLGVAINYASSLTYLRRFKEARSLLRQTNSVARRVLRESDKIMLSMRVVYGMALYEDPDATLDDLREAVKTLEDIEPIARRVLGGAHPLTVQIEERLQDARAALESAHAPDAVAAPS